MGLLSRRSSTAEDAHVAYCCLAGLWEHRLLEQFPFAAAAAACCTSGVTLDKFFSTHGVMDFVDDF